MYYHAPAKVNIFLKIVGARGNYHELLSRFVRVPTLCDTLWFEPKKSTEPFELVGNFDCKIEDNTLYKAYTALCEEGFSKEVGAVMAELSLHVKKSIPTGAGLGGGSSDSATFLKMLNEQACLNLTCKELMEIGSRVGADVSFFASEALSANVSGIGEVVETYQEDALNIEVFTPKIACHTGKVYQTYREYFLQTMDKNQAQKMLSLPSTKLVEQFSKEELNDLFAPARKLYPELSLYAKEGWFFSGSGSSFFRIKEEV